MKTPLYLFNGYVSTDYVPYVRVHCTYVITPQTCLCMQNPRALEI